MAGEIRVEINEIGWRGRVPIPCRGQFDFLIATDSRKRVLAQAADILRREAAAGPLITLTGPDRTGKFAAALAVCDRAGLQPWWASTSIEEPALIEGAGQVVVMSADRTLGPQDVLALVNFYHGRVPTIVYYDKDNYAATEALGGKALVNVRLRPPSAEEILTFLRQRPLAPEETLRACAQLAAQRQLGLCDVNNLMVRALFAAGAEGGEPTPAHIEKLLESDSAVK